MEHAETVEETSKTKTETSTDIPDNETPRTVPIEEHRGWKDRAKVAEKRLKDLESAESEREKAKLSEVERAQKEVEELRKERDGLVINQARTTAFMKAKTKIGDNFTLEGIEDKLFEKIGKLNYDPDSFDADVFELVDMAKKPKSSGKGVIPFGGSGQGALKKASEYSWAELAKIEKEDKPRYEELKNERLGNVSFNTSPYQPKT